MVTLIIGKKGSGKTKKLISLANEAVSASNGNVVVVEKGAKLTYDVTHSGCHALHHFLCQSHTD